MTLPADLSVLWHLNISLEINECVHIEQQFLRCRNTCIKCHAHTHKACVHCQHTYTSSSYGSIYPRKRSKWKGSEKEQAKGALRKCRQCVTLDAVLQGPNCQCRGPARQAGCHSACLFLPTDTVVDWLHGHMLSDKCKLTERWMNGVR